MTIFGLMAFKTAVIPLVVSLVVAGALAKFLPGESPRRWLQGLGLALGFAAGSLAISGYAGFPPIKVTDWLPFLGMGAAVAFGLLGQRGSWAKAGLIFLAVAGWLWLLTRPVFDNKGWGDWLGLVAMLGMLWLLLWTLWERVEWEGPETTLLAVVCASGAGLVSVLDGSALLGQLGGVLGASAGGLFLGGLWLKDHRLDVAGRAAFMTLLGAILLNAYVYAEVSALGVFLVYLAPAALVIGKWFKPNISALKRCLAMVGLALLPLAAAVIYLMVTASHDDLGYY